MSPRGHLQGAFGASLATVMLIAASADPVIELLDGSEIEGDPSGVLREIARPEQRALFGLRLASSHRSRARPALSASRVAQVRWRDPIMLEITSGPETECVSFGRDMVTALPDGWTTSGGDLPWEPASAPRNFHEWDHIPGAQWVWSQAEWTDPGHRERVLLRRRFEIPESLHVVTADLRVEADRALQVITLNGVEIPIPASARRGGRWDVAQALRSGENTLALAAVDRPAPRRLRGGAAQINAAGVAFRLEITAVDGADIAIQAPTCVAHLINGDRFSGDLRGIDDQRVTIASSITALTFDRDWVTDLLIGAPPERPLVHARSRPVPDWAPGAELADGSHLSGRILGADSSTVRLKPHLGDVVEIPLAEVAAIHINAPPDEGHIHYPRQENAARIGRVATVAGDEITGVLDRVGDTLAVNTAHGETVRISRDQVVRCVFPLSARLWAWDALRQSVPSRSRNLLIWGDLRTRRERPYEESLTAQISDVARHVDFEVNWIDDVTFASGEIDASVAPAMVVVDETESFPLSVNRRDDGLEALLDYARSGGALVLVSSGTPFYYGREWNGTQWESRSVRLRVPEALGFSYLLPGLASPWGRAFEIPENTGRTLVFERLAHDPPWDILPAEVVFSGVGDERFRPVMSLERETPAIVEPIYQLVDDRGEMFGIAMAAIWHTGGDLAQSRIYHVAPTLALGTDSAGEPVMHRLLPAVLADALGRGGFATSTTETAQAGP